MKGRDEVNAKTEISIQKLCCESKVLEDFNTHMIAKGTMESPKSRQTTIRMVMQYLVYAGCTNCDDWNKIANAQTLDAFIVSKHVVTRFVNNGGKMQPVRERASKSYLRFIHYALDSFFEFAKSRKYIDLNPMKAHNKPTKGKNPSKRDHLTETDFKMILDAAENGCGSGREVAQRLNWKERDVLILQLFMITGIRETALTEINIEDIDFHHQKLTVVDKGEKVHEYDIKELIPSIGIWMSKREKILSGAESDALFISNRKQRMSANSVAALVRKYSFAAIGKELSPHDLRAGVVTILLTKGKPLPWVSEVIGHSNPATTARYNVSNGEERKEAAALMASVCGII